MTGTPASRREFRFWLVCTTGMTAALAFLSSRAGTGFDAAEYYVTAEDWIRGVVPYRDVSLTKTPGIYLLTALLFKLFSGTSSWLPWYTTLINLGWAAAAAWALVPLIGSRLARWVLPVSLAVGTCCMINFWNTEQPMTLLVMLGFGVWLRAPSSGSALLMVGVLVGMASVFKLFALLSAVPVLLLLWSRTGASWPERIRETALCAAGFASVWAAVALWAASRGALGAMLHQAVMTPLFDYPPHRLYLADFLARIGWFVLPASVLMMLDMVCHHRSRSDSDPDLPALILPLWGLPFLFPLLKNQAAHYVVPFIPFAVAWGLWRLIGWIKLLSPAAVRRSAAAMAVAALLLVTALGLYKRESIRRVMRSGSVPSFRFECAELASWVGQRERVVFINAGPHPHTSLYWGMGERPYPWPFIAVSGFKGQDIADAGFEQLYRVLSDPGTRMVGIDLDSPMEESADWPYRADERARLLALLKTSFSPHPHFPNVYLRKGSARQNPSFRRGPFRGGALQPAREKAAARP